MAKSASDNAKGLRIVKITCETIKEDTICYRQYPTKILLILEFVPGSFRIWDEEDLYIGSGRRR